jgi:serine/threonine protein kinase
VALKVLTLATAAERFENEARALMSLRSPHVPRVIEVGRSAEGWPFIVTELLEGRTLAEALDELEPRALLDVLRQVALALEEAHARGIVHRDLKPANVFLETVGRRIHAWVLDFGVARFIGPGPDLRVPPKPQSAPTAGPIGTPAFMAPEVCRGEPATEKADIFALGIIAYYGIAGRAPYDYPSPEPGPILLTHVTTPPRVLDLDRRGELVPPALRAVVTALLEPAPEARPSASELTEVLEGFRLPQGPGSADLPEPTEPLTGAAPSWNTLALGAVTAVLVAAGVVGAVHLGSLLGEGGSPFRREVSGETRARVASGEDARVPGGGSESGSEPAEPAEGARGASGREDSPQPRAPARTAGDPRPKSGSEDASSSGPVVFRGFRDILGDRSASEVAELIAPIRRAMRACAARHLAAGREVTVRIRRGASRWTARVSGEAPAPLERCLEAVRGSPSAERRGMVYLEVRLRGRR